jgi:hypothetical protein
MELAAPNISKLRDFYEGSIVAKAFLITRQGANGIKLKPKSTELYFSCGQTALTSGGET